MWSFRWVYWQMKKTLLGLNNFYMVGQWVAPGGGLPSGVITGRWVTQLICKADKKKFTTTMGSPLRAPYTSGLT